MFRSLFERILGGRFNGTGTLRRNKPQSRRARPGAAALESLERRELLAAPNTPYALSGFTWNDPTHLTYSIAPDGVFWDHGVNNLHAVFDAKFGAGVWEIQIARALATWESVANIDFTLVPDSFKDQNALGLAQGDSRFGDIRFGGYNFANDTTTLAQTYFPPPNGSTASGDVEINTALNFGIGSGYDLYSVMLHEIGHSLGLDHVSGTAEVMHPSYQGIRNGVSPGDVGGVQAMYGARAPDVFQAGGHGVSFETAIDLTSMLGNAGVTSLNGESLYTPGDTEFFSMVAPPGASGSLQVIAAGYGYSMLSPKISLYDSNVNLIDAHSNSWAINTNAVARNSGVTPGQRYFVAVTGATGDAFSVGSYGLHVAFSMNAVTSPTGVPAPPSSGGSSNNTYATATQLGVISQANLPNLSLPGGTDADFYVFRNARAGVYAISAVGTRIQVVDAYGNVVVSGVNQVGIRIFRPRSPLYVVITSADGNPVFNYGLGLAPATPAPAAAVRRRARREQATVPTTANEVVTKPTHTPVQHWARQWAAGRGRA